MKLRHAADRRRLFRRQQFLAHYDYIVEWIVGDKKNLLDALTKEMAMFTIKSRADKGKAKKQSLEETFKAYTVIPKGIFITDHAQGNSMTSPEQTATGKGT